MIFASVGLEHDINTNSDTYLATSPYITGLAPIDLSASAMTTRTTATLGFYHDIEKDQRVGISGMYRQEPYQGIPTTSVMVTYVTGM